MNISSKGFDIIHKITYFIQHFTEPCFDASSSSPSYTLALNMTTKTLLRPAPSSI